MKFSHILLTTLLPPLSHAASCVSPRDNTTTTTATTSTLNLNYTTLSHRALTGLNIDFFNTTAQRWSVQDAWWLSAIALTNLLSYSLATKTTEYLPQITSVINAQSQPLPWWPQGNGSFRADSTDDTAWWALALLQTYDLTGNATYLSLAQADERYIYSYWSNATCRGGVVQDIRRNAYKNAISNELYISLAAGLYLRTKEGVYLTRAKQAWEWFGQSGMINGGDLVNDGLTEDGSCRNNNQTEWSYNQGVILGGLVDLYHATGNTTYLTTARKIADAAVASSSPLISSSSSSSSSNDTTGMLTESCEGAKTCNNDQQAFKGIFAYNLAKLDREFPGERPYKGVLTKWAESMYSYDRAVVKRAGEEGDLYDVSWGGEYETGSLGRQVSGLGLLVALIE
ncbi:glycoside hydrolase family 76 protein [Cercophora samala]|uniref:Glycoside hydrolase family 76 protein n=1 Tax=Cercophora samala TaxID=330535 RepID=A0AA39ZND4_9PEZI|nr:glycoside hydrolase family 76 protein [Cercophora samala]